MSPVSRPVFFPAKENQNRKQFESEHRQSVAAINHPAGFTNKYRPESYEIQGVPGPMFDKLIGVEERHSEVEKLLSDPKIVQDRVAYQKYVREHAELNKIVTVYRQYKQTLQNLEDSQELLKDSDPEIKDLARDEIAALAREKEKLEDELKMILLPRDPNDDKNVIVEIRAGTGGEEAALFAGDLFRMYSRYAETRNWKVEVMTHHPTGVGGLKEVIVMI
jgi:peptide chain release factor 1